MAELRLIDPAALAPRLERAFDFAAGQVRATIERPSRLLPDLHRRAAAGSTAASSGPTGAAGSTPG